MTDTNALAELPPCPPGHKRAFHKCRVHGRIGYRDYVPWGFSTAICILPCGCDIKDSAKIDEAEAAAIIAVLRTTDHHDKAEAYRNRALRAEQALAARDAEIVAWLRKVGHELCDSISDTERFAGTVLLVEASRIERGDYKESQP